VSVSEIVQVEILFQVYALENTRGWKEVEEEGEGV
jgi:hypothetical protein